MVQTWSSKYKSCTEPMWPSRASIVLPYNLFALIITKVGTRRSALLPGASDPVFDDPTQFRGTLCAIAPNTTRVWQKLRMLARRPLSSWYLCIRSDCCQLQAPPCEALCGNPYRAFA